MITFKGCKGSIVRLYVEDFLTYRKVEFMAGANVNLIMGPNGTGKSTIVCAICLGLAGKLKILERASSVREFIRYGARKAVIEIELYNPKGRNFVIKRIIKAVPTGATSTWYLNNERCQPTTIKNLTEELNIQLDNLCQFLPQERVQEFSRMDSTQLLLSTERAIGGETLAEKHEKLIEIKDEIKSLETKLEQSKNNLRTEEQRNQKIENDVQTFKEKEEIKAKIRHLIGRQAWIAYSKVLKEFYDTKKELSKVQQDFDELEANVLEPLRKDCEDIDKKLTKFRKEMNTKRNENSNGMNSAKRKFEEDVNRMEISINEIQTDFDEKVKSEKDRIKHYQAACQKLNALEEEMNGLRRKGDLDIKGLTAQLKDLEIKQTRLSAEILSLKDLDLTDDQERDVLRVKCKNAENQLKQLEGLRGSREKFLERNNRDLFKAVQHFSNPENRTEFAGEIHEPMILQVHVNDLKYGKMVEKYLGMSDLTAFFCEDINDTKVFQRICTQLNLRVALIHHPAPRGKYQRPRPSITPDIMKRYHFQKVLIDLIEANDYYISYLVENFKIHEVPCGNYQTDALSDVIKENTNITNFFSESKQFKIKQSLYTKDKSSTISHVYPATIFTNQINDMEKDKIQEDVNRFKGQMVELQERKESRIPQHESLRKEKSEIEAEFKGIHRKMDYGKKLEHMIQAQQTAVDNLKEDQIDLNQIKRKTREDIYNIRKKNLTMLKSFTKNISDISWKVFNLVTLKRQVNLLEAQATLKHSHYEDAAGSKTTLNARIKSLKDQVNVKASAAERLKLEAQAKSDIKERPEHRQPDEEEEAKIVKELHSLTMRLGFLPDMDTSLVSEYEERYKRIEDMNRSREMDETYLEEMNESVVQLKSEWLGPLKELIGKINANFSRFFASMNCVGEVTLNDTGEQEDFAKFGIMIKVKFRSSEPLTEFSGWNQSGGERAITTALYVLSLQELSTSVPFRVIDEINQGMDAKNEARFFNLLCSLAKGENTPQYFLLTPKMLPPLVEYPENVDFHFILNGPHVDMNAVYAISGLSAIGGGGGDDEEEEESSSD